MSDVVTVAIIGGGCSVMAGFVASLPGIITAIRMREVRHVAHENAEVLRTIESNTNGELDKKIARAVVETVRDSEVVRGAMAADILGRLLSDRLKQEQENE